MTITRRRDRPGGGRRALRPMTTTQRLRAGPGRAGAGLRPSARQADHGPGRHDPITSTRRSATALIGWRYVAGLRAWSARTACVIWRSRMQTVQVLNQWTFHARLYRAARYAAATSRMWSWCSWCPSAAASDAITTDEVRSHPRGAAASIIHRSKSTRSRNLGAVRIRLRSLIGGVGGEEPTAHGTESDTSRFTKEMKREYTILVPNMLPMHFELIMSVHARPMAIKWSCSGSAGRRSRRRG